MARHYIVYHTYPGVPEFSLITEGGSVRYVYDDEEDVIGFRNLAYEYYEDDRCVMVFKSGGVWECRLLKDRDTILRFIGRKDRDLH